MDDIIIVTGKVTYPITLDPTVWIFDNRKFELSERIADIDGLAMELAPFIEHTEPSLDATKAICQLANGKEITLSLAQLTSSYLCFALDGKPIKDGGPALLYFADGSNKHNPISNIRKMIIE